MSAPRRRIVRPAPVIEPSAEQRQRRARKLRVELDREQTALRRWLGRLKRAFHSFERVERRIASLDRRIALLEKLSCPG